MKSSRPMFLDLTKIKFPIMAILSIFHRITGVLLFFAIPFLIYQLGVSLSSPAAFNALQVSLFSGFTSFVLWVAVVAMSYHLLAGIRHMIMDLGFFEHLCSAKVTAVVVLLLVVISAILWGVWIW